MRPTTPPPYTATESYWQATIPAAPAYPRLAEEIRADVAIIGGGITGLTAAAHLLNAGKKVALVEAGRIGCGTTGGTSGHLEAMPDQGVEKLIADFDEASARQVTLARMEAIRQIEAWCQEWRIDADFCRIPAYVLSESDDARALARQCEKASRLGLETTMRRPAQIAFARSGFHIGNQARFHSLRYLQGLARRITDHGVFVFENSEASPPEDGAPCVINAGDGRIVAQDVILATHSAFLGISQFDLEVAPYQSYVLAARLRQSLPDALYWDDQKPYHYFRLAATDDPRLVLIGGADHKTGQGDDERDAMAQLEEYARSHFDVAQIEQQWSAELFEPADGLPYVGRVPFSKHLFVATGFSGTGLTFGTMAGRLLADLLLGNEPELAEILAPSRIKPLAAASNFLSENLNVARRFVTDRFAGESVDSLAVIPAGQGRLVRYRGQQWAVYRDDDATLHVFSPSCTHAGCHVQWNEFEKTWDCPCHGGRYSPLGKRIYGPPPKDLARQELDELERDT